MGGRRGRGGDEVMERLLKKVREGVRRKGDVSRVLNGMSNEGRDERGRERRGIRRNVGDSR